MFGESHSNSNQHLIRKRTEKVLLLFFPLAAISLITSYVLTFYLGYSTDKALLYNAEDPGYVTPYLDAIPVIGKHYFNDFLQVLSWALAPSPYSPSLDYPAAYLPLMILVFKVLSFFPISIFLSILILASTTLIIAINWLLFAKYFQDKIHLYILIFVLVVFSRPFLLLLDRGNTQGIVFALQALFVIFWRRDKKQLACTFLIGAICLKGYPILLVMIILRSREYRHAIKVVLVSIFLSLLSLVLVDSSNLITSIHGFVRGVGIYTGNSTSGLGVASWIFRIIDASGLRASRVGADYLFVFASNVIALLLIGILFYLVVIKKRGDNLIGDLLIVGFPTLINPVVWDYNGIWIPSFILALLTTKSLGYMKIYRAKIEVNTFFPLLLMSISIVWPVIWRGSTRIGVGPLDLLFVPTLAFFAYLVLFRRPEIKK